MSDADVAHAKEGRVIREIPGECGILIARIENAASIAAMILTTEALITDVPEKEKAPAMPPGGGGMDY